MRLICPNCGAQYEVPDDVIPDEGRDVQCSNCGHTWFEYPGQSEMDEYDTMPEFEHELTDDNAPITAMDDELPAIEPSYGESDPNNEPINENEKIDIEIPADQPTVEFDPEIPDEEIELTAAPARPSQPVRRRTLDPEITDILREEAEREKSRRQAEAEDDLISQAELSLEPNILPEAEKRSQEAARRINRLKDDIEPSASEKPERRSELLPDIEEINSSLRSTSERDDIDISRPNNHSTTKRGFRVGFFTVIFIAVAAALIYAFASEITAEIPQIAEPIERYVNWVDELRLWLDLKIQSMLTGIENGT